MAYPPNIAPYPPQSCVHKKFTQLRAGLPAATVPDEKDLAKYTTELITLSYSRANAAEFRQLGEWLRNTMAWGNWNLDIPRHILGRLHKKKTNASAGDRTAERTRVTVFLIGFPKPLSIEACSRMELHSG